MYSPDKDWIEHEIEATVSANKDWIEHEIEATVNGSQLHASLQSISDSREKKRPKATNLDLEDAESIHPSHKSWQCCFTGSADTNQQQVALWMTRFNINLAKVQPRNAVHFTDTAAILNSNVLKMIFNNDFMRPRWIRDGK